MTDYKELNALQRDIRRCKRLAQSLLAMPDMEWDAWPVTFFNSIVRQVDERLADKRKDPLTILQAQKLVELRDETIWHEAPAGFSIKALVSDCLSAQHLLEEDEAEFLKRHHAAQSTKLRRREIYFLFHCARKAMAIEPYQGWFLPKLDLDAA
jgi:hypothetical protein